MTYSPPLWGIGPGQVIHTLSPTCLGPLLASINQGTPSLGAWPSANRAILLPFTVPSVGTVYKLGWHNGGTVSGNVDIGIYSASGTRLVSSGSTAQSGTNSVQMVDVTDTALAPGTLYYVALAVDNTSATFDRWSGNNGPTHWGLREKATSFALPDPLTGTSVVSATFVPMVLIELESR